MKHLASTSSFFLGSTSLLIQYPLPTSHEEGWEQGLQSVYHVLSLVFLPPQQETPHMLLSCQHGVPNR